MIENNIDNVKNRIKDITLKIGLHENRISMHASAIKKLRNERYILIKKVKWHDEKKESPDKKDLSWCEKLKYIWCVLRYSKHMANWVAMNCECCHHYELERIGNPIRSDAGGQKEFQQKYRCLHCGAIGIVTQIWIKERDEDGKE